ncbi:hypothetical protein KFE25_010039 [Diacronema lutheri]|uniref:Uncharacterized protein n=1 Tax=Diacronema lutheri TaxID=2081491 RepID=A0A8J5XGE0_DIALT|nr:hypothetical protein KFE25_010039 [Diacronema lutheri]
MGTFVFVQRRLAGAQARALTPDFASPPGRTPCSSAAQPAAVRAAPSAGLQSPIGRSRRLSFSTPPVRRRQGAQPPPIAKPVPDPLEHVARTLVAAHLDARGAVPTSSDTPSRYPDLSSWHKDDRRIHVSLHKRYETLFSPAVNPSDPGSQREPQRAPLRPRATHQLFAERDGMMPREAERRGVRCVVAPANC